MAAPNVIPRRAYERAGFWFASGVVTFLAVLVFACLIIDSVVNLDGFRPADDSDVSVHARSGMKPRRDALTGCEYFESRDGDLVPRMTADGRQVCRGGQ